MICLVERQLLIFTSIKSEILLMNLHLLTGLNIFMLCYKHFYAFTDIYGCGTSTWLPVVFYVSREWAVEMVQFKPVIILSRWRPAKKQQWQPPYPSTVQSPLLALNAACVTLFETWRSYFFCGIMSVWLQRSCIALILT